MKKEQKDACTLCRTNEEVSSCVFVGTLPRVLTAFVPSAVSQIRALRKLRWAMLPLYHSTTLLTFSNPCREGWSDTYIERPSSMETERHRGTSMSSKLCQSGLDAERDRAATVGRCSGGNTGITCQHSPH